ncbi:winged helix-turn-helix transcriptional regulator [Actinomadura parmotrematis]|uniref:Winged helix-turn-helix transcriptional regulator n=1 Tax=Actinomadura parmotrematis TaxID=2864039 RepID=A0ABS7FQQ4_9ACTN|nr:winged helix-turn-helix transcriptional regulator [Actinomadura parmotrematis]MBW8481887.1 winged helix-turn-helix transcriptional regulator [Actinomadura parmotrematis]
MEQRNYNQYCATARTLDLVGERWTLLLIRELLTGPKRFGDLQANLRGLGTGLLAARLKHLEREGLARKVTLPPPARTPAYALTEAGAELGPAVLALARWGMTWALGERQEGETFRPGWAVLGLEACFLPEASAGLRVVYEFRVADEVFHADIADGTVRMLHGPAQRPDASVTMGEDALIAIASGRSSLGAAIGAGDATVSGSTEAIRRLGELFRFPEPKSRKPEQAP